MRIQLKRAAKECRMRGYPVSAQINTSRQLSLKLIANVTYGYTAAGFSGRMPCAELADAIVQTGRDALERAITLVDDHHDRWGARVIYGDTVRILVVVVFPFPSRTRYTSRALPPTHPVRVVVVDRTRCLSKCLARRSKQRFESVPKLRLLSRRRYRRR